MPRKGIKMNKSVLQRGIILILCSCILFSICPVYAFAAENQKERVVRIGVPDDTYDKINGNGKRSGYGYEYLQKIAGYTGWNYEYVDCTWENCFDKLKNDELDMIEGVSYTEERAETMLFSAIPMGDERYYVYVKPDHTDISSSDTASFNGKKIGVLMGYLSEMILNEWEKKYDLHTQHVNVSNNEDALKKIADGEIDAFVSLEDSRLGGYGMVALTNLGSSKIYFAIGQSHSDLKTEMDNAMRRITDDDPYYADELHKQFLSVDSVYFLTGEEQKWLSEHGAIKIGCLINDGGVSTLDTETGKVSGLIMDYTQLAQNCLEGQTLKFDLKGYDSQEDMQKALHDGEIDMIFHVMQNTNAAEDLGYDLTDTVWRYNMAAATVKKSFDENAENTVAIPREDSDLKSYVSYNYPQWHVKEYATWKDAKKAVYNGKADCMIMDSGKLEQYSDDNKLYVGTYDGVNCIDLDSPDFQSHKILSQNVIYSIFEDADGVVWLGSSEGLSGWNKKTKELTTYTTEDGLPSNTIYAIQGDGKDFLWISTNAGISQFQKKNDKFINYYVSDGLQGNEFYKNASFKDKQGIIWFGGMNGITYFNPQDIINPAKTWNIRITDFFLHNNPVRKGMKSGIHNIINCPVFNAKEFYLSHKDNVFSIEFATLELNAPEHINYLYSINDEKWISLPKGVNRISFSKSSFLKSSFVLPRLAWHILGCDFTLFPIKKPHPFCQKGWENAKFF